MNLENISNREGFWLTGNQGNNSFAYNKDKKIWVPGVIFGGVNDLKLGNKIVFADIEDGIYKESIGLNNHLWIMGFSCPVFICDNHNYVLESWKYCIPIKPVLVHIDQHRDEANFLVNKVNDLKYNYLLQTRVCDYINWAKYNLWINKNHISLCESKDFNNFKPSLNSNYILNIDLDIFALEQTIISYDTIWDLIFKLSKNACLITIATSPLFIDQKRSIKLIEYFISNLRFK